MTDSVTFSFFGHSHLSALLRAGKRHERSAAADAVKLHFSRLNYKNFHPNFEVINGEKTIDQGLQKKLRFILRRDAPDSIFLLLMGNEYNSLAMMRHPTPYDFYWPESGLEIDETVSLLPFNVIKAELSALADRNALLFLNLFSEIYKKPIYLMPPPPPIQDEAHIRSYPSAFADRLNEYGLSPATFRLKMWRLYCVVLQEAAVKASVSYVDLPTEIFNADGFLKEIYWSQDPTHANPAYGDVLLSALIDLAGNDAHNKAHSGAIT